MHRVPDPGGRHGALLRGALVLLAVFLLIAVAVAAPAPAAGAEGANGSPAAASFRDGEVIVGFKPVPSHDYHSPNSHATQANARVGATVTKDFTPYGLEGVQLVRLPPGLTVASAVASYRADPAVRYAEPNYLLHADVVPDDVYYSTQWAHHSTADHDIDTPEAWDLTTGSSSIVVAVVDTGIDYTHDELAPNIWTNPGETAGNGVDDDNNGYVDDVRGWDFVNSDNDPKDDQSHGSHCAGIIGAVGNNWWGVTGTMWQVRLMPLKFLDSEGEGPTSNAIAAVLYARAEGVPIISCSFGDVEYSQAFKDAIDGTNALFACAAGNGDGSNNDVVPHYPSSFDSANIIAVAATNEEDGLADFSNIGPTTVDLGAPGSWVYSTVLNPSYDYMSGTSMAAPFVAGVAGLVRAREPGISVSELKARILRGVEPIPALDGRVATSGRLNAYRALLSSPPPIAWFGANTSRGEGTFAVQFFDQSAGVATSWSWDFGDGGTSTERNPVHVYSTPGTYTVSLTACGAAGTCDTKTRTGMITVRPENYLALALEAPGHPWTTGGNASWEFDTAVTHDGVDSARTGGIGDFQSSHVSTTVTVTGDAASVSFWWKVSSARMFDNLHFLVDGAERAVISGEVDWSRQEFALAPGTHTLIWVYEKDIYFAEGLDAGWLDQVSVTGSVTQPDLAPGTFAPPAGAVARTFTIPNAVRNDGDAPTGPFTAWFYLSADTTIATADTPIGTRSYTGLGAGVTAPTESTTVTIPASVPAGAYYLGMIADPANVVAESDEANNVVSDPDAITIPAPAPTVSGITPSTGIQGTTVAITDLAGSGFATGAAVRLTRAGSAEIAATDVAVVSPTRITCLLHIPPAATTGAWNVTVENPGGQQGMLVTGFTVGPSPAVIVVPGGTGTPTDTDGDGVYDDVNGNERADFADVVLYFNQMEWIAANEPVSAFDCNGNGRIDFADVVWLFNRL